MAPPRAETQLPGMLDRPDSFGEFEFETVTVDKRGAIVERSLQRSQQFVEDLGNGVLLEMVIIQGGLFRMGSVEWSGNTPTPPITHRIKRWFSP